MSSESNESVIVLHGFGGHWLVMHPLARSLRSAGFKVQNWGYASLRKTIDLHAAALAKQIEKQESDPNVERFHLVAHSMGSILVRVALGQMKPSKLGRIVMLVPPNKGSHAATRFSPYFSWLSTTLTQIQDSPNSFVNQIETQIEPEYEVGVVQADRDFVVQRPATYLDEAKEYVIARGFHSGILFSPRCAELVKAFISSGSFSTESDRPLAGKEWP